MLCEVLRQIFGLELRPDPSEAWLMTGRAPGTCSSDPPPLEPRDDMEPAENNEGLMVENKNCLKFRWILLIEILFKKQ